MDGDFGGDVGVGMTSSAICVDCDGSTLNDRLVSQSLRKDEANKPVFTNPRNCRTSFQQIRFLTASQGSRKERASGLNVKA